MNVVLNIPPGEQYAKALEAATILSLAVHGLLLGLLAWTLPHDYRGAYREDTDISIELAELAPISALASAPQAATADQPTGDSEALKRELIEAPTLERMPKKTAKKAERKKASAKASGKAVEQGTAAHAASEKHAPKGLQASNPAPAIGANNPRPNYPELARKRGQEGVVRIRCQVDAAGTVSAANVAVSSGHKLLDDAALKTVYKWRFKPAINNGAPVGGYVVVPIEFRLR